MVVKNKQMENFSWKACVLPPAKKKKEDSPGIRLHPSTEHGCTRQIGSATYIQKGWWSNPCRPEDHAPVMCYCDSIYKSYHSLHVWLWLSCSRGSRVNGVVLKRALAVARRHYTSQVPADGSRSGGTLCSHTLPYQWNHNSLMLSEMSFWIRQHPPVGYGGRDTSTCCAEGRSLQTPCWQCVHFESTEQSRAHFFLYINNSYKCAKSSCCCKSVISKSFPTLRRSRGDTAACVHVCPLITKEVGEHWLWAARSKRSPWIVKQPGQAHYMLLLK